MNLQSKKDLSEVIKNYAQIVAVVIAGIWTQHVFSQKESPNLEPRGSAHSEIKWIKENGPSEFTVLFNVTLENIGVTPFNISKIQVRGWEFSSDTKDGNFTYYDYERITSAPPFFDRIYQTKATTLVPFPIHYSSGASFTNAFAWLLKIRDEDCEKFVLFRADFYKEENEVGPAWTTYSWDQKCTPPEIQEANKNTIATAPN
jgi:hypothetical protein